MKTKKMFLLFAAFIFAAVAGYNMHFEQTQNSGDISLADIAVMTQAQGEQNWNDNEWYRMGNTSGTSFCCCPGGSLTCDWEVECASHICDDL